MIIGCLSRIENIKRGSRALRSVPGQIHRGHHAISTRLSDQFVKNGTAMLRRSDSCVFINFPLAAVLMATAITATNLMSNSLSPLGGATGSLSQPRKWVRISAAPPEIQKVKTGARFELECEAVGSPAPLIQWLRGGEPTNQVTYEEQPVETNSINEVISDSTVAKVRARLVIQNAVPSHQGRYTCVATSGGQSTSFTTTLLLSPSAGGSVNLSDYYTQARVVLYYTVLMAPIGRDAVLPCRALGGPATRVYWLAADSERPIDSRDPKATTMSDGSLKIRELAWSDMGAYTCVVTNAYSKDSATTFVYPTLGN